MTHRIKLLFESPARQYFLGRDVFAYRVTVTDSEELPPEIFLWRKTPYDARTGETHDEFIAVCSTFDLTAYPANEPAEDADPPFFRRDTAFILAPTIRMADKAAELLKGMVAELCLMADRIETLESLGEDWYPDAPPEPTSTTEEP